MRRGKIDQLGDLTKLDLQARYGDKTGTLKLAEYAATGFQQPARYYRGIVQDFGFGGFSHVADMGGAYGRWSVFLAEVNDRVTVVDINDYLLDLGQGLARDFGFDNIDFWRESILASSFPDASFDAAWYHAVIYQVDRDKALAEMRRILKPGGRAFIGSFNGLGKMFQKLCMGYERSGFEDTLCRQGRAALRHGPLHAGPPNYGTRATLDRIFEPFGFEVDYDRPVLDFSSGKPMDPRYVDLFNDLPCLAERFETDQPFRDDLVANYKNIMRCMEFDMWFAVRKVA